MAKIGRLKKNGVQILPKTVTKAVKDTGSGKMLDVRLEEIEGSVSTEEARATAAEGMLNTKIATEKLERTNTDNVLNQKIAAEETRALAAEAAEEARALEAEDQKSLSAVLVTTTAGNVMMKVIQKDNGSVSKAIPSATVSNAGVMSAEDKVALNNIKNVRLPRVEGIKIVEITPTYGRELRKWQLRDADDMAMGPEIVTYKDQFIKAITFEKVDNAQYLKFVYIDNEGVEQTTWVNMSEMIIQSEFKNGLKVADNGEVSVKLSQDRESKNYLFFAADGSLTLKGIENFMKDIEDDRQEAYEEAEGKSTDPASASAETGSRWGRFNYLKTQAQADHTQAGTDHLQAVADHGNAVLTTADQGLTDTQKSNARTNIGAAGKSELDTEKAKITDLALKVGYNIVEENVAAYKVVTNDVEIPIGTMLVNSGVALILGSDSSLTQRYDIASGGAYVTTFVVKYIRTGATEGDVSLHVGGAKDLVDNCMITNDAVTTDKIFNNAVTTDKIVNDSVTTQKIADGNVTTDKINNDAVTTDKAKFIIKTISSNLYNKNDANCVEGKYVRKSNGELADNANYKASAYIEIKPSTYYICNFSTQVAWYDVSKTYISGEDSLSTAKLSPSNAKYVRISFKLSKEDENRLNEGETLLDYEDYYAKYKLDNNIGIPKTCYGSCHKIFDLNAGDTIQLDSNSAKNRKALAFSGTIGNFGTLYIGHGKTGWASSFLEINDTNFIIHNITGTDTQSNPIAHGLEIENNIQIIIEKDSNASAIIRVCSNGYEFIYNGVSWNGDNGNPFVESVDSTLTNCSLSWSSSAIKSKIWLFGDSYFSLTANNRWTSYLIDRGSKNILLDAYPGMNSRTGLNDLINLLKLGNPEIIVWCLGMNDKDSTLAEASSSPSTSWLNAVMTVKELCEERGIELVLSTIPSVYGGYSEDSGISTSRYHKAKNDWVKSSGLRYIDFANAVGASDVTGLWYNNGLANDMLEGDATVGVTTTRVHPTSYGALALYHQAVADVPELVVYGC